MAKAKTKKSDPPVNDDMSLKKLAKALNDDANMKFAYMMDEDDSPSHITEWFGTGIKILDVICSNKEDGAIGAGKIADISGTNSSGKTLVAMHMAKEMQTKKDGFVLWIDTENAFSESLATLIGLDVKKRFLYTQPDTINSAFRMIEKSILYLKNEQPDSPLLIIWDSLAATPSEVELESDYSEQQMGISAREVSKGLRKIRNIIGRTKSVFVILNQLRQQIGNPQDPFVEPHGMALGFFASIRIRLFQSSKIKDENKNVIGNVIKARVIKNRFGPPFRDCEFKMYYNRGVDELESVIDVLVSADLIQKSAGWYTCSGQKMRLKDVVNLLKTDADFHEKAMKAFYQKMIVEYNVEADNEILEGTDGIVRDESGHVLYNQRDIDKIEMELAQESEVTE